MRGLGDNIYQRAYIREIKDEIHLETPWPELYLDLPNVKFVKSVTVLRTQKKNINAQERSVWVEKAEKYISEYKLVYGTGARSTGSVQVMFQRALGAHARDFSLPDFDCGLDIFNGNKIAIVRPVTLRSEWFNSSRNPDPKYVNEAISVLKKEGFFIISVADLEEGKEWIVGKEPVADLKLHYGELNISNLFGLIQSAEVLVGGLGWILPAAIACNKPLLLIAGGQGAYNSQEKVADPRIVPENKVNWILPDNYCMCAGAKHDCSKKISNFKERVSSWIKSLN